jgi:hypothetical protein
MTDTQVRRPGRGRGRWPRRLAAALALAGLLGMVATPTPAVPTTAAGAGPGPGGGNPVLDWNLVAEEAIAVGRPPASAQVLAGIVQVAVYDTVVAIAGGARPFAVRPAVARPVSTPAAVATAAHHVLVARVPAQAPTVDARYRDHLAAVPEGPAKRHGVDLGARVAAAILGLRSGDGFDNQVPYVQPPPGPGVFEPVAPSPPVDTKLAQVRPLTFAAPSRFRPDGPARLAGDIYARDLAQVQALGRADSAVRTPAQTETARFWSENTFQQWGRNLRALARARRLDVAATARLLAMTHTAVADGVVACFEAKYHYLFWRPVHAIVRAGTDGNPRTSPDPTWTALLTVNHPEYPSAHGCWTSALAHALGAFFGTDRVALTVDSTVTATSRGYRRLSEVVREVRLARIAGGLHYRHSMLDGERLGRRVARHVTRHHFRATSGGRRGPARP